MLGSSVSDSTEKHATEQPVQHSENGHGEHHIVSYGLNTRILLILLVLTVVTVGAAQLDFGYLNVLVAMTIATTKALFVVLFFMHLKYERAYIGFMVFIAFLMLAISIGFVFFDIAYRA